MYPRFDFEYEGVVSLGEMDLFVFLKIFFIFRSWNVVYKLGLSAMRKIDQV